jgi:transcription initiation factor IIF auxiliary subunit
LINLILNGLVIVFFFFLIKGKVDLEKEIDKVQFLLDRSFYPSVINITKPPFKINKNGWGEFEIFIKIYFVGQGILNFIYKKKDIPEIFTHQLNLTENEEKVYKVFI